MSAALLNGHHIGGRRTKADLPTSGRRLMQPSPTSDRSDDGNTIIRVGHEESARIGRQLFLTLVSLHPRINLSPFTKDFRGEEHYNESID